MKAGILRKKTGFRVTPGMTITVRGLMEHYADSWGAKEWRATVKVAVGGGVEVGVQLRVLGGAGSATR